MNNQMKTMNGTGGTGMRSFLILAFGIVAFTGASAFAAFEQIGAGARPIGMGSAFTAIANDAHAVYYNPAGLMQVRRPEITAGYGRLFSGLTDKSNLSSGYFGAAIPLQQGKLGTAGIGWLSLSLQNAYREDSIHLAYGKELLFDGLFVGGAFKILRRSFASDTDTQADPLFAANGYNTSNYSLDFGVMYRPSVNYSLAFAVRDLNQPNVGLGEGDKLPAEIRGGFAYYQKTLTFDGEISKKDKDVIVSMGLEKWLFKFIGLRAGMNAGSRNRRDIATGMSYRGQNFSLDYAFVFPLAGVESTAGSHRFGLTVMFGKPPEKTRWDFESDDAIFEHLLEEKSHQINAMEKELELLKGQNHDGRLEDKWVRDQILNIQKKLQQQESEEIQGLKHRLMESNVETERTRKKLLDLENQIRRLAPIHTPKPAAPETVEETPAPQKPAVPHTYVVQEGETLQSLAQKFYKDKTKWVEIYDLNSDRIERGGTIRTGQILLMPQ